MIGQTKWSPTLVVQPLGHQLQNKRSLINISRKDVGFKQKPIAVYNTGLHCNMEEIKKSNLQFILPLAASE